MSAATREDGSRGSATLEILVIAALAGWLCLVGLQIFSAMYAGQAASRAAWDAARAHSLGQSAVAAANASVPGAVEVADVQTFADGVRVTVRATEFMPGLEIGPITRTAYVP